MSDWQDLTEMTHGEPIRIERVRLVNKKIVLEGDFELPPLARLTFEDQVFIATFIRCHGSIKEMEASFGISYPTVKNRLNKIAAQLGFVAAEAGSVEPTVPAPVAVAVAAAPEPAVGSTRNLAILEQLSRGEITADQAVKALEQL